MATIASGCPDCHSVYYMLLGTNSDGEELYRCLKCRCEWKWKDGKRSVMKQHEVN
jgi:DNA-directed RNA polymerase subunit M/transcription elongation factor TFIIS